jgi:transposase InsO family protein
MPWKACSAMEERLRFVARLLEGEAMTDLCREFDISRKTGYKLFNRYKDEGSSALTDRSRRPVRYANQLPPQIESLIVGLKRDKPHWGARKIRELLVRRLPGDLRVPANSTIHAVLDRHGLVSRPGRRRNRAQGTPLSQGAQPNDLWCTDFKGEFRLGNGRYCFPLTVTDHASRFLLLCEALDSVREDPAIAAFEQLFRERGLPQAIRSDNGVPFASPNALFNLSKLSVRWLRLGIAIERIKPGHPQQNGRHERMHLTLKKETTRPPGMNSLQQQARFDHFVHEFNTERPHEALQMRPPAELYSSSSRPYTGLPELHYPLHDRQYLVTACGRICMHRKKINLSTVLAGQKVGLKEVDEGIWLVSFMHYDLGYIDLEQRTLQPLDNPFGTRLSPMS